MKSAPIFVVGTGRCGSTIFHHVLSYHPNLAWFSRSCATHPTNLARNRQALRALDLLPFVEPLLRKRIYPVEAYELWDHYCPGFSEPCRDLQRDDVTPTHRSAIRRVFTETVTLKRTRMLVKLTGWPRIGFLKEIFPNAKFIHIYRDGRAVANSLLNVIWWSGLRGPNNWRWGRLTAAQETKWNHHNQSFVALAAIEWERLMSAFDVAQQELEAGDLLKLTYETMCQDPIAVFKRTTDFCDLPWTPKFERIVQEHTFRNTNHKWREQLTDSQATILNTCLDGVLQKYGYAL